MKYSSSLILNSFRKNDIEIISKFITKLKFRIFRNIVDNLLLVKIKVLSKIFLFLFLDNNIVLGNNKKSLFEIINLNYFYTDINNILFSNNYKIYNYNNNMHLFYNFMYDLCLLNFILEYLSGLRIKSFSHMPKKRKHFTVLKSPHTDKKSREQFSLVSYRKFIYDKFDILHNVIKYTGLLDYESCQFIYRKFTNIS